MLVLEDLHWSDAATLDWLAYVARRREPARLLVLGTYRPAERHGAAHPLHRRHRRNSRSTARGTSWRWRAICRGGGGGLSGAALRGGGTLPAAWRAVLHQRTEGHPLFLVDRGGRAGAAGDAAGGVQLAGSWRRHLEAVAAGVPDSLRQLIEQQFERLAPAEQALLEAASVAGVEFAAAAVAAGRGAGGGGHRAPCARPGAAGTVRAGAGTGVWPDGTVTACYRFRPCSVSARCVYDRVPAGRRARWHRQIGRAAGGRLWRRRPREMAAELADAFCARA